MLNVLLVEDDVAIADAVVYALSKDGIIAQAVSTLRAARLALHQVDLIILDLTLPDGSGFSLLDEVHRLRESPRVIVLTSRDEDIDCVAALEAGADDFVTKPFSPRALVARVRAVLRRGAPMASMQEQPLESSKGKALPFGLMVDGERRQVMYQGRELALTKIEFDLLAALAQAPGRVRTRGQLVEEVWGPSYALTERTVDSHLKGLRRKLEDAGAPSHLVETVRGVGFKLREGE